MLAADYPFLDVLWTMLIFFAWIIWFWLLITVFADLFRRHDIGGGMKTLWIIFVILLPFLGVFIYLISQGTSMAERNVKGMQTQQAQMDAHIKSVAGSGGAAEEIDKAKKLLDSGAITQAEFDAIKAKALAT
ncbi:MAG: SHOCT domain-containing protein [Gaiellaceae bacterium]